MFYGQLDGAGVIDLFRAKTSKLTRFPPSAASRSLLFYFNLLMTV